MNRATHVQQMATAYAATLAVVSTQIIVLASCVAAAERQLGKVRMGIHVMRPDGSEQRPLAVSGEYFHHGSPAWSPDGKQLAFDAYLSGFQDPAVFLCKADGSDLRRLTSGAYPRWSPDGKQLVFYSGLGAGSEAAIFVIDADGSNRRRLTEGAFPDWSPDGGTIVFARSGSDRGIWTIRRDGGGLRQIAATQGEILGPVWSPDGKRIAYAEAAGGNADLYLMNSDGGDAQQLTAGEENDFYPAWSPDGRQIAFVRYDHDLQQADVYLIDATGSNLHAITSAPGYQIDPAWSPDGKWIAYGAEK